MAASSNPFVKTSATLATAKLPRRAKRALEKVMALATTELTWILQHIARDAELELMRQSDQAATIQLRQIFNNALFALRDNSGLFPKQVLEVVESGLATLDQPRKSRHDRPLQAPEQGLSLVDETNLDENSTLDEITSRHEIRNALALQLMGHRFGVLAGAPAFDAEHIPFGPHMLGEAMRQACEQMGLPLEARLWIYQQFDKMAVAQYPILLEALNTRLADDGILPYLSFIPVRVQPAGDARRESETKGAPKEAPPGNGSGGSGTGSGIPGIGDVLPDAPKPSLVSRGFARLQGLLAKRRKLLAKLRPGNNEERTRAPLPASEVLDALKRLRQGDGKAGGIAQIRQDVLARARQRQGHGVALVDDDNDSFELMDLFQAQLERDMRSGTAGEALTQRLRLPLLQVALSDHQFFEDERHPARQLLEAVSSIGARWNGDEDVDPQVVDLLRRAVDTVLRDPDASTETFAIANDALQQGLQQAARKLEIAERRQVDAARGRNRLDVARHQASTEITRLLGTRKLPRFSGILFDQAWADVLTLCLLRNGEDSDAWRRHMDLTATLLDACTSDGGVSPDPALVSQVQEHLGQVGYHADDAATIAKMLASGRSDDESLVSRTELMLQLKARARLGDDAVSQSGEAKPPRNAEEQAAYERLCALQPGTWLEITDEHGQPRRCRLAWFNAQTDHALLLNRRAQRVPAGDLDALARQMAQGRVQVVERDLGPSESAWQRAIAGLQRLAGSDAGGEA